MHKQKKQFLAIFVLIGCILLSSTLYTRNASAENPPPFFSVSIIAPNVTYPYYQWATLMVEQLPKIGIGINIYDHTSWSFIYPRVFDYPGPYPIPSYENGGYDILFIGWGWGLDFNPKGLFDSESVVPIGDNFYQYTNPAMDDAICNYTNSLSYENRIQFAKKIQSYLYNDIPQTTIFYPSNLYTMSSNFDQNSWDGILWQEDFETLENWTIPGQTEFHYATPVDFDEFHLHGSSRYDLFWLKQIYTSMVKRDPITHRWTNNLAESYSSADGLTWTINIHPNATWADGTALTTQDVNYSYNLYRNPDFDLDWPYKNLLDHLNQSSLTIINDYEYEITFFQPYMFHENNLDFDILPKHIWEGIAFNDLSAQAATWALTDPHKLIGAGPYYLEEYDNVNESIHLKVNPYYNNWSNVTPICNDVYFDFYSNQESALLALQSDLCDMIDAKFFYYDKEIPTGISYQLICSNQQQEIAFNCMHPIIGTGENCPISSPESGIHIRKAISHLIPREIIIEEILNGKGLPGITAWNPISHGFDDSLEPPVYSLILAMEEMRKAGYVYPEETPLTRTSVIAISFEAVISTIACGVISILVIRYKKQKWEDRRFD